MSSRGTEDGGLNALRGTGCDSHQSGKCQPMSMQGIKKKKKSLRKAKKKRYACPGKAEQRILNCHTLPEKCLPVICVTVACGYFGVSVTPFFSVLTCLCQPETQFKSRVPISKVPTVSDIFSAKNKTFIHLLRVS